MNRSLFVRLLLLVVAPAAGACVIHVDGSDGLHFDTVGVRVNGINLDKDAQRTETRALELAPGETLALDTSYGDIEVSATSTGPAELRATLHANGRTVEEAQAVLARYELVLERGPHGPTARLAGEPLRIDEGSMHLSLSAHVDFSATVPAGTALAASTESGDIRAHGVLGAARLQTEYGAIAFEEARGDVTARSGSGDVQAGRVEGGLVELESSYGKVSLQGARTRNVSCKSGSGDLAVADVEADTLELATDYGNVHVRKSSGKLRAHSGSGDVRLHDVRGAIDAGSDYGTVEVDGELTGLRAKSGSGDVRVRAESAELESDWTLASDYGSVVLRVPEGFGCVLDAKTSYGGARCDFPITIEAGKKKSDGRLKGTVGGGGRTVSLSSGSGDVALKKL